MSRDSFAATRVGSTTVGSTTRRFARSPLSATTPFPNYLLDEAMPSLKDTEWRVLCVIVRQTLGWQRKDDKARKTSDWLTQSQLVEKTGRDRAALSRAIDVLVRLRLIEVKDARGRMLLSPRERRHCKGHLFFGLYTGLRSNENPNESLKAPPPQLVKSEFQTLSSHSLNPNSLLDDPSAKSEFHRASKANTTKEKGTKENDTKGFQKGFHHERHLESLARKASEIFPVKTTEARTAPTQQTSFEEEVQSSRREYSQQVSRQAQDFITLFEQLFEQTKSKKAETALLRSQVEQLEKLLDSFPTLDWTPILREFFASDTGYIMRRNHSLAAFLDSRNIFLLRHRSKHFARKTVS